jgi:GMP reductase
MMFDFSDVTLIPAEKTLIESRSDVSLRFFQRAGWANRDIWSLPVINAPMDVIGNPKMVSLLHKKFQIGALGKYYNWEDYFLSVDRHTWLTTFRTFGFECDLVDYQGYICLDVANGHMLKFINHVQHIREKNPHAVIMAGNVCTPDGAINLYNAGADIVKIGIAQGGHCDTKNKAGVGVKQASLIYDVARIIRNRGFEKMLICSDGGIKTPADIGKAIALGANFVMAGTMFAGHDENDGDWAYKGYWPFRKKKAIKFYGMSSKTANEKHNGGLKEYRASEGLETLVPYKGPLSHTITDICGSLASTCSYLNMSSLSSLLLCPDIRINV